MGYKARKKIFKLVFDDDELEGLEVRVTSLPMRDFLEVAKAASRLESVVVPMEDDMESVTGLFERFIENVKSWNLEDEDGSMVPVSVDGLLALDLQLVLHILQSWLKAISGVSDSLGKDSTSGERYQEASLPMEE